MGGHPTDKALALIRELESADRGWYAGPVGWVDVRGEGEFAVAIRSALLAGERALLYAGCGVVADSDSESAFEESCLKLRPMLAALGANGRCRANRSPPCSSARSSMSWSGRACATCASARVPGRPSSPWCAPIIRG